MAASLADDLRSFQLPALHTTAGVTYDRIHDILLDVPTATLDHIVDALAHDYGMTPAEVRHRYRRLPYWYTRHRRDLAEDARGQLHGIDHFGLNPTQRAYWQQRLDGLTR